MAVASLVMGIIGFFINPLSILAIIFGAIALGQIARDPKAKGKGMATTGLVLGVVVAAFWIIALFWLGSALWWVSGRF
ncbi:MAG: hypothetical protein A2Z29_00410 [Chloroflexi bacterium RBG_16_56_11]|nr:MAG: hypothetical protein A2Z29_00410 [Chloroflexi bacterium RBG_16_56_11]